VGGRKRVGGGIEEDRRRAEGGQEGWQEE